MPEEISQLLIIDTNQEYNIRDETNHVFYVKGTQTATTGTWTGNLPEVDALYEGLAIDYWLPYAGSGNATLNLTLKDGTNTGAINCYYSGTTRLTTHIGANNIMRLVYQVVTISGTSYTGWWLLKAYDTNDVAYAIRNGSPAYQANSAVYRYQLLFQVDDNKLTPLNNVNNSTATGKAMLTSVDFLPFGKIYYYNNTTNVAANGNMTSSLYNRIHLDLRYSLNCAQTLTAHSDVYLKCARQANGKFRITADPCWTQTLPSTNDGYYYIRLGRTYSTYQMYLEEDHPIYYHDGTELRIYTNPQEAVTDKNITGNVEYTGKATKNYTAGSLAIVNNQLLRVTQNIASGGTITIGTNAEEVDLETLIEEKANQLFVARLPFASIDEGSACAGYHNSLYREKSLGTSVTAAQYAQISDGTFDDMFVGDYWTINNIVWRIAGFDYWLGCGDTQCTTHHVVIVPDARLLNTVMNTTNTTAGAYIGTGFYTGTNADSTANTGKASANTIITNAFGAAHILTKREYLANTVTDGYESAGDWYDSTWEVMTETMLCGCEILRKKGTNVERVYNINKSQLPLFRMNHSKITNGSPCWLRDVANATSLVSIGGSGFLLASTMKSNRGIRPAFGIYA